MASTKIFFENLVGESLYILLMAKKGNLEIHVFDEPFSVATEAPAGKMLGFEVNAEIRSCIHGGQLAFEVCGHNARVRFAVTPGRERLAEGPIFTLSPVGD